MAILVAYASKHGSTQEIAERIAEKLRLLGKDVESQPVEAAGNVGGYEAVVIGSAAYYGSWLKEAIAFVRNNRADLSSRPVWLFSSGPLGTKTTDAQGRDLRETAEPKEIAEFREAISPQGHRVFFGALHRGKLGFAERVVANMPGGRELLPEGDFRDWQEIEAWAEGIAAALPRAEAAPQPA